MVVLLLRHETTRVSLHNIVDLERLERMLEQSTDVADWSALLAVS
jgi:hypothetical protein